MNWHGLELNLPAGRLGWQQDASLLAIARSEGGTSFFLALALRGKAKNFDDRYRVALTNIIAANRRYFQFGGYGPRGGWGARLTEEGRAHFK